jgi:hypothetical protein
MTGASHETPWLLKHALVLQPHFAWGRLRAFC